MKEASALLSIYNLLFRLTSDEDVDRNRSTVVVCIHGHLQQLNPCKATVLIGIYYELNPG